jgi:hypothetical protein
MCKSAYYEGGECPADLALQAALLLAQAEGWQRCYSCQAMVELDHSCNHITYNIRPSAHLIVLISNVVAIAELNSAISVVSHRRPVPVHNRTKTDL